uniref:Ig-like domain-containing protein n=1 Tax=Acanthochromis polyacanthus TaxID=80966 RepID=A0A3Q1FDS7_9TELE
MVYVFVVLLAHSQNWRVTYTQDRMCASKGSAVYMNCSYTYPAQVGGQENILMKKFWFVGKEEDLQERKLYKGRVKYDNDSALRIMDLKVEDSAEYKFRFITNRDKFSGVPGVTLTVTVYLHIILKTLSPSGEIVEGSSVNLTCSSDANPAANYTWYKENEKQPLRPGSIYNFASISSEDEGNYCCKSENKHGQNSSTLFISVQYAPKLPSVSGSVSGRSVNLTCSSDANPAANYTWYKENENSPKSSGQTFTITHAGPEQSGNYKCEVQNSRGRHSSTFHLVVVQISLDDPGEGLYLRLLSFLMCSLHFKPVMFLDCGRKPENLEKTHACTGRTCKVYAERFQEGGNTNRRSSSCNAKVLTTKATVQPYMNSGVAKNVFCEVTVTFYHQI